MDAKRVQDVRRNDQAAGIGHLKQSGQPQVSAQDYQADGEDPPLLRGAEGDGGDQEQQERDEPEPVEQGECRPVR